MFIELYLSFAAGTLNACGFITHQGDSQLTAYSCVAHMYFCQPLKCKRLLNAEAIFGKGVLGQLAANQI